MSEAKKRAPRKKRAQPEPPKTASAKAEEKTQDPRADEARKAALLAAALPHAAFDGFTQKMLEAAAAEAGVAKPDLKRLFLDGPLSLIEVYSKSVDAQMQDRLAALDLPAMKIRARIAAAVMARLAVLKPHKEAARRAAALLSLPMHAGLAARLTYRSVDAMWRAAGDTSTDFNFYTKRGILAGVYGSTLMRWFNDTSADEAATTKFLADRIENVMQFEKFKTELRKGFRKFSESWAAARKG